MEASTSIAVTEKKELVAGRGGSMAVLESSLASSEAAAVVAVGQNTWLPHAAEENMIEMHFL